MPFSKQMIVGVRDERRGCNHWPPPWIWGGSGERAGKSLPCCRLRGLLSAQPLYSLLAQLSQGPTRAWGAEFGCLLCGWFMCSVHSLLSYSLSWFYSKLTWDHKRNILLDCHMFGRESWTEWSSDSPKSAGLRSNCFKKKSWRNVQYWTEGIFLSID